ncbi:MAG: Trk system potassium uptake protein TrkA, partial [uncultured Rubrobacteraceae bacterium]
EPPVPGRRPRPPRHRHGQHPRLFGPRGARRGRQRGPHPGPRRRPAQRPPRRGRRHGRGRPAGPERRPLRRGGRRYRREPPGGRDTYDGEPEGARGAHDRGAGHDQAAREGSGEGRRRQGDPTREGDGRAGRAGARLPRRARLREPRRGRGPHRGPRPGTVGGQIAGGALPLPQPRPDDRGPQAPGRDGFAPYRRHGPQGRGPDRGRRLERNPRRLPALGPARQAQV